jgi:hypothetical protein
LPVAKFLQDQQGEPYDIVRRMHQVVEVQHTREQLLDITDSPHLSVIQQNPLFWHCKPCATTQHCYSPTSEPIPVGYHQDFHSYSSLSTLEIKKKKIFC